ncbi:MULTISPECIES: radical SAM/SPASM domain-containing protein [Rhizobium]|uniref:Radical SAM protein with 4Fe4S-binding SPASM domain n=1 Tax=Rhizobium paranaense TaxID=1650438 RepID=A0A7W8XWB3_9HYPH|nr:radical SAM protein with 4Fe4S-binding SPASM domain [Rhizobium paranaense]
MSFFDRLQPYHVYPTDELDLAREMFRRSVSQVEIEIFSYCNRRCWFCPNESIDRITHNEYMRPELYSSIIAQLASIQYSGMITYSRYNEPLADRIILDRLREARAALPHALLHTNTNGDYLDHEYLNELYDAGMRSLNIQIYLKNHERYDHDKVIKRGEQTLKRLQLPSVLTINQPGVWYEMNLGFKDMKIRLYGRNFEVNGTSRGNQVDIKKDYVRTLPCNIPFWNVYVDYNGKMVPCCNYRSDIVEHEEYVLNDLNEQPSIFLTYASPAAAAFRRSMLTLEEKKGACSNCHFGLEQLTPQRIDRIASTLAA